MRHNSSEEYAASHPAASESFRQHLYPSSGIDCLAPASCSAPIDWDTEGGSTPLYSFRRPDTRRSRPIRTI